MGRKEIQSGISCVTPFAGVWIEINLVTSERKNTESLPSRECGLKWTLSPVDKALVSVTPFAGVWIEIFAKVFRLFLGLVTPFAGVWIEIKLP